MRTFLIRLTIFVYAIALTWSAAVEQTEQRDVAELLLDADSGMKHSNEGSRQARQFYGYYGRPYYNGYGGYGGYYRPYYGGYGYGRPYYGGYYRPYYGNYIGFYG